jgi:hypothetical protein
MILQVFKGQLKADADEMALASVGEKATPILRQTKGFKKLISSVDRATNQARVINLWDSQEDADALAANPEWQRLLAEGQTYYSVWLALEGVYEVTLEI